MCQLCARFLFKRLAAWIVFLVIALVMVQVLT